MFKAILINSSSSFWVFLSLILCPVLVSEYVCLENEDMGKSLTRGSVAQKKLSKPKKNPNTLHNLKNASSFLLFLYAKLPACRCLEILLVLKYLFMLKRIFYYVF